MENSLPTEAQKTVAEQSLENMLDQLDPQLAQLVQQKFNAESQAFSEAAREHDPSNGDPAYWAKKACKRCYGLGITGKRHVFSPGECAKSDGNGGFTNLAFVVDVKCSCGSKKYQKWLAAFRVTYNAQKEAQVDEGHDDSKES